MPGGILGGWGTIRSEPQLKLNQLKTSSAKAKKASPPTRYQLGCQHGVL